MFKIIFLRRIWASEKLLVPYLLISKKKKKKASHTVDHLLLINKLKNYGISGVQLNCFKSYVNDSKQSVKIGTSLSSLMPINIGIPQGSILGPLLYIFFVNDLPNNVICNAVIYADDISLLVSSSDT